MTGAFRALGHVFDIDCPDTVLEEHLREVLSSLASDARPEKRYVIDETRPQPADWLMWEVNQAAVRSMRQTHVVIHAAAACLNGRTVVLPAPMEAGKTTTVAALVRSGFGYLTDEALAVDVETLAVVAYPKPLSLERPVWPLFDIGSATGATGDRCQLPPTVLHPSALAHVSAPPPVTAIVSPQYRAGQRTVLVDSSRGNMLFRLAQCTFDFEADPRRNLDVLARLCSAATCHELSVSNLDDAVAAVSSVLSRQAA